MSKWIVEMIDAGCDCCSFVPIGQYESEEEATRAVAGDKNLLVYEEPDCDESEAEQ